MRRCYLVCYDISDPKRLRRVHRTLRGYGITWQYSVFFCVLKEIDRKRLEKDLKVRVKAKEDQVMFIDLGEDEMKVHSEVKILGKSLPEPESGVIVI